MAEHSLRDDYSISDDTDLWRRIRPNWVVWDDNDKMPRVSSAAFDNSRDGSPLSVLIADVVRATGRNEHDMLVSFEGYSLVAIKAGHARENKQGVARTPTLDLKQANPEGF